MFAWDPLVDEAGLRVVSIFARPGRNQVVVERGRQEAQPHEVFQPSSCMTAGTDFSTFVAMKPRTSSCVRSVHLHMAFRPGGIGRARVQRVHA